MKDKIFTAICAIAFALTSCTKESFVPEPITGDIPVTVSFVSEPVESKGFFDATAAAATETWEKSLSSLTVLCFDAAGNLLVQRNFTAAEVSAKKASFALPKTAAGTTCTFYAIANKAITGITTKTTLSAILETAAGEYNGTFAQVTTASRRNGGFIMSGSLSKAVAAAGVATDVAITLKRTVAKVAVQTSLSSDFSSKYQGAVRINSAVISKAASQTPVIAGTANTGAMSYSCSQTPENSSGKYNNLFYLFESGSLATGSRVLLTLDATYDRDGNFTTTGDQMPVTYTLELAGTANSGQIIRNGYYRIAVTLNGLTGQNVAAIVTVADWEAPITQAVNLGQ